MVKSKSKDPKLEISANFSGSEEFKEWCKANNKSSNANHGTSGALYFVGFVGALIYWMQAAVGFGAVVTGFLKAMVWPAYIVYKLLEMFYGIVV